MMDAYGRMIRQRLINSFKGIGEEEIEETDTGFQGEENKIDFVPSFADQLKQQFNLQECAVTVNNLDEDFTQWTVFVRIGKTDCGIAIMIIGGEVEVTLYALSEQDLGLETTNLKALSPEDCQQLAQLANVAGPLLMEQPRYRLRITTGELQWDEEEWKTWVKEEIEASIS